MRTGYFLRQSIGLGALLLLLVLGPQPSFAQSAGVAPAPIADPEHGLALKRAGDQPLLFTPERIAALPQVTVRVTQKTGKGEESTQWSGPLLWDVLTSSGLIDAAKHGEHPKLTLHAAGRDGYTVSVAVAELSPEFENKQVIVADHLAGAALPGGALRLIVPGDHRAGRSVRDLVRITVD